MRFIDEAEVLLKAGHGGPGAVSFRREKYVPMGGPDGGEGGRGGHILYVADPNIGTLMDFRYKRKFFAQNGENGGGRNCYGRAGEDIILRLPVGTVLKNQDTGEVIADLSEPNLEPKILCRGGRGGKGNSHFRSSVHQAPRFAQPGEEGEELRLKLELKLLADVAIIGLPNAGKSSLIASISAARPKIADYPFTTLTPNLGVVSLDEYESFVVADVPGLIEGAHMGAGLGIRFLKHIERSHLLLHIIDVSLDRDPEADYNVIRRELESFDPALAERAEIIVFNKMDALQDPQKLNAFTAKLDKAEKIYRKISVATREGVQDLLWLTYKTLQAVKAARAAEERTADLPTTSPPDAIAAH